MEGPAKNVMDEYRIRFYSGEFGCPETERAWRDSQRVQDLRQVRLIWGAALACVVIYIPLEHLDRAGAPAAMVWPRLAIIAAGSVVLGLLCLSRLQRYRDWITGGGLVLAMTCYGLLLAGREQPSAGALLLLVLGSYLFSPGSFVQHAVTGVAGSLGAVLAAAGTLPWLEASYLVPANLLAALTLAQLNRQRRRLYRQGLELRREIAGRREVQRRLTALYRQNRSLLYNTLPAAVAEQLRRHPEKRPARQVADVTLLFADIVGFSTLARSLTPRQLLTLLNELFSAFDNLAGRHELEKIKTIGDAYFAVAGLVPGERQPAVHAASMALELGRTTALIGCRRGLPLSLRIGLHTGPVVAGVLGHKRYAFDVWGDAVNIASRLQAAAPAGGILVSETTRHSCADGFRFGPARELALRGCGPVVASALLGGGDALERGNDLAGDMFG